MASAEIIRLTELIKEKSAELGFDLTGIARARTLAENREVLEKWCEAGMHDKMSYLQRDIGKRADPEQLFPGVRSMVVTGFSYHAGMQQTSPGVPVLSRYTYGRDYHEIIKEKLEELLAFVQKHSPLASGRVYVDSTPVMEKPWAVEAGLGWQGKHSVVINSKKGSFFFIGILALGIELEYDEPFKEELCGKCRLCIDHCPTGAINEDRTIDARRCIANLTIENRGPIPEDILPLIGGRIYGCDKCQEVCPWTKNAKPHSHPELFLKDEVANMKREEWADLTMERFTELFSESPVGRVKFERFKDNIKAILNSQTP